MSLVNSFDFTGNIGRDIETKFLASGVAVSDINLGVSERRKVGDDYEDKTEWFRITLWRHDNLLPLLTKGKKIRVRGRIENHKYDKDGVTHYTFKFVAEEVLLLSPRSQDSSEEPKSKPSASPAADTPPWGSDQDW